MKRIALRSSRRSISTVVAAVIIIAIIAVVGVLSVYLFDPSLFGISNTTTIVFGATLSMTGNLNAFGAEQNWTLTYAINYVNSLGGIPLSNGTHAKIKLVVLNDASDAATASSNLNALITTYHADIIMGELGGVQDSTAQQFASANQILYIGPVYISSYKTCTNCANSWIFAPFENETNEAHVFLNYFHSVDPSTSSHNVTIAFFGEGDPAALANNNAGEAYARQLGYTVCTCSVLNFAPGPGSQTAMQNFISAAKSAGAEAVYGLPLPPDATLMLQTAQQLGYTPQAWLLTRGTAVAPFALTALGGLGNESAGVFSAFPWDPAVPYQGSILGHKVNNSQIVSDYEKATGQLPTLEGVYYTQVLVAVDAIAAAGNLSSTAIRNELRSMTFETPMGTVNFTPGGQWMQSDASILLMQWQNVVKNGQTQQVLQILEPTSIATTNYVIYPFSYQNAQNSATQTHMSWPPT